MNEIEEDLVRAQQALHSAERNLEAGDVLTAANRTFVACENAVYVILKTTFGSSSISRQRILMRLGDIDAEAKELYDTTYDLRVQADYGKEAKMQALNKDTLRPILQKVKVLVRKVEMRREEPKRQLYK